VNWTTKIWKDADHAFMNQDGPHYNAKVAAEALEDVSVWLKKVLA